MLFNSFEFLVFLPLVFALYWFVFSQQLKWQNMLVLVASYFFYGWWSWAFMGLLMLSTLLDYAYGFWVASPNRKRAKFFLTLSIINNLGILAVFKYYNFFATEIAHGLSLLGLKISPYLLDVALPVGISFYTFHGMSYVFDIYRGKSNPVRNFVDYALFVSFFPLLVAGPIERAHHLLPQIQQKRSFNYSQLVAGGRLILWGMFKKVIIADTLASTVDAMFGHYEEYNGLSLLIGIIGFSFQIYCDFSGYSDIAMGTAKLFGFELLSNFRFPYFSRDIAEFWRRWHISLSSWFRDYLYIPLGGSRVGTFKAVRNTFIIFLVSGFWHGASWNFIIWGGIHALGFLPILLLQKNRQHVSDVVAESSVWPSWKEFFQMLSTFVFVSFAWIFFRADDLSSAVGYIQHLCWSLLHDTQQFTQLPKGKAILALIIPFLIADWYLRRNERDLKVFHHPVLRYGVYLFLLITLLVVGFESNKSFIYFVF